MTARKCKSFLRYGVRFMIKADARDVDDLEIASAVEQRWDQKKYAWMRARRDIVMSVATFADQVVGLLVYRIMDRKKCEVRILRLLVHPRWRRVGVGTLLVEWLTKEMVNRDRHVMVEVDERELPLCLFFKSAGFRATRIEYGCADDEEHDLFVMEWRNDG